MDSVPASCYVLVVQRLVDITHEMDHELGRLRTQPEGHGRVQDLGGVILDGSHDTTLLLAVAVQVDCTAVGRVILSIDEMEDARKVTPFGVADGIRPSGDAGQVILVGIPEKSLEVMCCLRLDEIAGDVGDSNMTEACRLLVCGRYDASIAALADDRGLGC